VYLLEHVVVREDEAAALPEADALERLSANVLRLAKLHHTEARTYLSKFAVSIS